MQINFTPSSTEGFTENVTVNDNPIGFILTDWNGAKHTYSGYIGKTRVFINVKSARAAKAEMVKHISELHRKWTRKDNPLDQKQNPFRVSK